MGYKKSNPDEVLGGRDEVRTGPKILKVEGGSDGKPKATRIRIMPPRDDSPRERWYAWVNGHFKVGPNSRAVRCLSDFEEWCPVCAESNERRREGDEKGADEIRQQQYGLVNVVKLTKSDTGKYVPDGGVQVWRVNPKWLTRLINDIEEEDRVLEADDLEKGFDVVIRRTGTGTGKEGGEQTSYEFRLQSPSVFNGGDFSLAENNLYDLESVFERISPEKLELLTSGPAAKQLPAAREPFADDDDDDDDEDDDVEEGKYREVPTPAPAPAKEKKSKTRVTSAEQEKERERLRAQLAKEASDDDDDDDDDD